MLQVRTTAAKVRQRWVCCCRGAMLQIWALESALMRLLLLLLLRVLRKLWQRWLRTVVECANGRHRGQRGAELQADRLCHAVVLVQVLLLQMVLLRLKVRTEQRVQVDV